MRRFRKLCFGLSLLALFPIFSAFTPTAITLDFGPQQIALTESQLSGGWFNYEAKQTLTQGKNLFARAANLQEDDTFEGAFPDIVQYLNKLAPQFEVAADAGTVIFHPHQTPRFTVTNQQPGRVIDRDQLYGDILSALKGNKFPVLKVPYRTVQPTDPEKLVSAITKRSEFSTRCHINPDRETNIALALSKFDGLTVNPGATVSFNEIVGPRTAARGYQTAKIIVKGEYVDGVGGGVCQVSTTIFNAVAQAGLHIIESHHHTLPSSYIALGKDAMVSSGADLRFVNNTGAPIYFETKFHDHQLHVTIYGRNPGPHVTSRLTTEVIKEIPPKTEPDPALSAAIIKDYQRHPEQYRRVITQAGHAGYMVNTYLETYQGTRRLSKKLLRRATYQAVPERYTLKPAAAPTPDDPETAPSHS